MTDLDKLARTLTKAGKKVLRKNRVRLPEVLELPMVGLYRRDPAFSTFWNITPLGLALKAHIERTTHAE